MSKWNYIASSYKPTSVSDSIISYFLSPTQRNLCVSKSEILEIYQILPNNLSLVLKIPFNSQICYLANLPSHNHESDTILVLTHTKKLLQLSFNQTPNVIKEIIIYSRSRKNEDFYRIILNSSKTLACIYAQKSYFTLININQGKLSDEFTVGHSNYDITDCSFVHGTNILAVIYSVNSKQSSLQFYEVVPLEHSIVQINESFPFEEPGSKILSAAYSGPLIFFINFFIKFDKSCKEYSKTDYPVDEIKSYCEINDTRWLISNSKGRLFIVSIESQIKLDSLGITSIANSICHLDTNVFYLGSKLNESKLIKVLIESAENEFFIEEVQDFLNLGPILDLKVIEDQQHSGNFDIMTCSGTGISGGFRKITKGVELINEFTIEIPNITGIWTISINRKNHTHLLMSFSNQTRVFEIINSKINQINLPNPHFLNINTITISTIDNNILHITPTGIYLYTNAWDLIFHLSSTEIIESQSILHACIFEDTLSIIIGSSTLITFLIKTDSLIEYKRISFEYKLNY